MRLTQLVYLQACSSDAKVASDSAAAQLAALCTIYCNFGQLQKAGDSLCVQSVTCATFQPHPHAVHCKIKLEIEYLQTDCPPTVLLH